MRYLIFALFCLINFESFSQKTDFTFNEGETAKEVYFSEIPFEFIKGQIIIRVQLNGQTYRFFVDTGAPTSISENLYNTLLPQTINRLPIKDSSDKHDSLNVVLMPNIKIGDIAFENTPALVIPDSNFIYNCFKIDGAIGSNLLRKSVVRFSYPKKTLTLTNSVKKLALSKKESTKLFLTPNQSSPFFWLELKGEDKAKVHLLFDSGMEGLFDLSLRNYKQLDKYELFTDILAANGAGSFGIFGVANDTIHYKMKVRELNFKGTRLQNAVITTTKTANSRIGTELLKYAELTLDYKHKRIYFTPIKEGIQNAYEKQFPIQPIHRDGKLKVGFVWLPAEVPNISKGDEIVRIDGIDCSTIDICELMFMLYNIDKDKYEIECKGSDNSIYSTIIQRK